MNNLNGPEVGTAQPYDEFGIHRDTASLSKMTSDGDVDMPANEKGIVGDILSRIPYYGVGVGKAIILAVFITQFIFFLVYGLAATDQLEINADKTIIVRDTPACLAAKAAHPNAGSDFRCKEVVNIGNPSVLTLLIVQAGWLMIIMLWASFDWGRIIARFTNRLDDNGEVDYDKMKVAKFMSRIKKDFLYPHTEHLLQADVFDTDEFIWKIRTWGCCDLTWFFILTGALGQTNIYLLISMAMIGFAFSLSAYIFEYQNRLKVEHPDSSEMGILRNYAPAIIHGGIIIVVIFMWAFMYGSLEAHAHPRGYSLFLFLAYIIYIALTPAWELFYLFMGRVTSMKDYRDEWWARRSTKQIIDGAAFMVFFGGLLGYALLIWSRNDHLMI